MINRKMTYQFSHFVLIICKTIIICSNRRRKIFVGNETGGRCLVSSWRRLRQLLLKQFSVLFNGSKIRPINENGSRFGRQS